MNGMKLRAALMAAALALGACSAQPPANVWQPISDTGAPLRVSRDLVDAGAAHAATPARIAVTHAFSLRVPSADVEAVQRRHLDDCTRLGCMVLTTNLDRSNAGRISAHTSIRIRPDGFADFAKALEAAPATVVSHSQSAEDKTIPLLDMEKRVEVKTALRDRLAAMLKDPAAKTPADLLAIEKELSQVQGDIEAAIAQRDYLRTITDTVRVDISYIGVTAQTGGVDLYAIQTAVAEFGQTMVSSGATLITFLAIILPWVPLVVLLAWAARRSFRRWRARRA
jgi:hypothetical protein